MIHCLLADLSIFSHIVSGTLVYGNTILAMSAHLKIGIAQGAANWGDSVNLRNYGARVYENTFGGTHMSFGLSISGVKDWTTVDNVALDSARFKGGSSSSFSSFPMSSRDSLSPSFGFGLDLSQGSQLPWVGRNRRADFRAHRSFQDDERFFGRRRQLLDS